MQIAVMCSFVKSLNVHAVDVVRGACEVQQVVALLHHLIDGRAVFLRLRVTIAGAVDQLVDDVVQPEQIRGWLKSFKVVSTN